MTNKIQPKEIFKNFYMCFLVVYMIMREVIPLQFLIGNPIITAFIFLAGSLLILWDLLTDRDCLKGRAVDFLVAFILIVILSSVINYKYGIAGNINCIAAMVLEYFIFFPMSLKKDAVKTLKMILNTLIITLFFFVSVSIVMYLFSIDYTIFQDYNRDQGFDTTWGRLWGVFNDPNTICYVSMVSVFASGYLMIAYKKIWAYLLYTINILVQMTFIMLVVSRSAFLILLIIPVVSAIYPFLCYIKSNKKKAFGSVGIMVGATVVICGLYFGLQKGMPYLKSLILNNTYISTREKIVTVYDNLYIAGGIKILNIDDNHITMDQSNNTTHHDQNANNDSLKDKFQYKPEPIIRKDQKDDYSNGRFARWMGGIAVFQTTPIVGTSPRNTIAIAKERTPNTVMGKYGWITHCSYLEVLVNTGILGAAVMFSCLIYIAVLFFKSALKKKFDRTVYLAFLCFITVAAGAFFVSDIFFFFTINALLFFYLLGYLYQYASEGKNGILYRVFSLLPGMKSQKKEDVLNTETESSL